MDLMNICGLLRVCRYRSTHLYLILLPVDSLTLSRSNIMTRTGIGAPQWLKSRQGGEIILCNRSIDMLPFVGWVTDTVSHRFVDAVGLSGYAPLYVFLCCQCRLMWNPSFCDLLEGSSTTRTTGRGYPVRIKGEESALR